MNLGIAKALGMFNHHERRIWYVYPHLNDGSSYQQLNFVGFEGGHHCCFFFGFSAAMY
jgi:hypothetical protein